MGIEEITKSEVEPIGLNEAKTHLRIEQSQNEENELILGLIAASRQMVESYLGRQLVSATWELSLQSFKEEIELPHPPVQSITSITYIDQLGVTQTVDPTVYELDSNVLPPVVRLAWNQWWPCPRSQSNAVRVKYVAGYGDSGNDVPFGIRAAMLLQIGYLYENRESVNIGNITSELPLAFKSLLNPFRVAAFK